MALTKEKGSHNKTRKTQVVAIHGGDPRVSGRDFLAFLKQETPFENNFKISKGWKNLLQKTLGDAFDVFNPQMPRAESARHVEWKVWFEKLIPFLKDDVILIGHSLGAIFLTKYLSENRFPRRIGGLFLVAGPFWEKTDGAKGTGGFTLGKDLSSVTKQAPHIVVFHSKDDPVVPFSHMDKYAKALQNAKAVALTGRLHIWQDEFPEIIREIRAAARA